MTKSSVVIAAVAAAGLLPSTVLIAWMSMPTPEAVAIIVLAAAAQLAVVWQRSRPTAALALVTGLVAAQAVITGLFVLFPSTLLILLVIYGAAAYGRRMIALAVVAFGSVAATIRYAIDPDVVESGFGPAPWMLALLLLAIGGVAWTMGLLRRAQVRGAGLVAERLELEQRERVHREDRAAAAERARISRDLHDVLAHSLTVIVGQARVARFEPDQSGAALEVIESTARDSLRDLRGTLRTLRDADPSDREPQPPADLATLLVRARESGLQVDRQVIGRPRRLAGPAALALHRFIQEGVTNALRHGDGVVDWVERWEDGRVVVTLSNAAAGEGAGSGARLGLIGMRERLASVGGTLSICRGERFSVTATIPYDPEETA